MYAKQKKYVIREKEEIKCNNIIKNIIKTGRKFLINCEFWAHDLER